jgi:two-component system CheB/CheR fusion protein
LSTIDARRHVGTATRSGVSVERDDGHVQLVNLTIEPLGERSAGGPLFLVLFDDQRPVLTREEALSRADKVQNGVVAQTERELRETRDRLQSTIEEYESRADSVAF